jgi:hypothetical protein
MTCCSEEKLGGGTAISSLFTNNRVMLPTFLFLPAKNNSGPNDAIWLPKAGQKFQLKPEGQSDDRAGVIFEM